ncbi:MAG: CPBP family intramembrane metalloprotease [candidate division Zixibacteria bacterium]|nr:CPBP family intramembrane metalloprotease [candidate division Zixibacteria bacterium]
MKAYLRLLLVILTGAAIYFSGLYVVPKIGFIKNVINNTFIDSSNVTQATFLVMSLVLMLVLGRGKFKEFGFRGTALKPLGWSVLISIPVELGMIIFAMFMMSMAGGPPENMDQMAPKSFWGMVISVWIVASTCEEILYRGLLYGLMKPLKKYGFKLGNLFVSLPVIICAVMFALGHLCLLNIMPGIMLFNIILSCFLLGLIAGYFRETTGSLVPAVAVHMTFNIIGFVVPLLLSSLMGF